MADTVNQQVIVNGVNFDCSHISVILLGSVRPGVKSVAYNYNRTSANTYGIGNQPVSHGYGQTMYTGGSLEFIADELESIIKAAPNGDITNIPPFEIKIAFTPDALNPNGKVETLKFVRLTGRTQSLKGGDTHVSNTVSFEFAGITYE
ncbi:hypothetical protein EBQ81_00715 [bacterium]|nr:hypothetical protein [bacterium]